ncbi:MAG: uroporphyrinogen-III synthase [Acidobacteriota bacterium]|nr:uroporphyrinogen-III synthase [Acidobacteriota bacterium]
MAKLIESYGGKAIVVPSMREIPLESNTEALAFVRELNASRFDMVIFLTGVGTRALARVAEAVFPLDEFRDALKKVAVVARGPKPVAALKEMGVDASIAVPEPNTWKDLLRVLDEKSASFPLRGKRLAVQEYGAPNQELLDGLAARGAQVTRVPVYRWELPEDTGPLRAAVEMATRSAVDVALFTTSVQVLHLLRIAQEMGLERELRKGFERVAVGSIGPVTSEEARENGLAIDFEPEHPKMGFLVNEAARRAAAIVAVKRSGRSE